MEAILGRVKHHQVLNATKGLITTEYLRRVTATT